MARIKVKTKIFYATIMKKMTEAAAKHPNVKRKIRRQAENKLEREKKRLVTEFNSHPVTQEIEEGPEGINTTGTLGGYGNLFSFIGFYEEEDPTELVRYLMNLYELTAHKPKIRKQSRKFSGYVEFSYRVGGMTKRKLFAETRLKWLGKSWLKGIESGLSGLGQYLHDDAQSLHGDSRSGTGVQVEKRRFRSGAYTPTKYISQLINSFQKRVSTK
jgi:hypothetical protein